MASMTVQLVEAPVFDVKLSDVVAAGAADGR